MTQDFLYRGVLKEYNVRFSHTLATGAANTAVKVHNCDPISGHLLARAVGAALLASPLLSGEERYSFRWTYDGAFKGGIVEVDANSCMRGYVSPAQLAAAVTNEAELFGFHGNVTVIKTEHGKVLNSGTAPANLLDVVNDLSYFFSVSDQLETETLVMCAFNSDPVNPVAMCHGFMLQAMPDCDLTVFQRIRSRLVEPEVRELLKQQPTADCWFEKIIGMLLDGDVNPKSISISQAPAPQFKCNCNYERMKEAVKTLGKDELKKASESGEKLRTECRFCSQKYEIAPEDLC